MGLLLGAASCGLGEDQATPVAELGGATTRAATGQTAFSFPAPTLDDSERRTFEVGDSFFTQNWVIAPASTDARDGLGPLFNAQACSSCHLRDGRGLPGPTGGDAVGLLLRLSVPGTNEHGGPLGDPVYGDQLQDHGIPGVAAEGSFTIVHEELPGSFADGTPYTLRAPTYEITDLAYGDLPADLMVSPRLAPQMIGMGLLEAIPEADLLALTDPDDEDEDGISGRANQVWNPATQQTELGRFGWKANAPTVAVQAAGAFNGDVGVTSAAFITESCSKAQADCSAAPDGGEPEITGERMASVTFYSRTLAVPAMRNAEQNDVADGAKAFEKLGCSSCHTPTHTTGTDQVAALSQQAIHPYTDLLLHDMGTGLADGRPDFLADGNEWRTPPLWGLGLIDDVNGQRFLLHDGRARTVEEAVLWHGGEAEASKEAFRTAAIGLRNDLLAFLEAL